MARPGLVDMDGSRLTGDSLSFSLLSALTVASNAALNGSIAIRFGAGYQADAFFLAYTIPGIIAGMLATTMPVVLVPSIVHLAERYSAASARRTIAMIGIVGLALWLVIASAGMVGGASVIKALTPSIPPDAQHLAIMMSRWTFAIVPLAWLSEFLRAVLNSQRRFLLPLVGGGLANTLAIGLILGLGRRTGIIVVGPGFIVKMLTQIVVSALGLGWTARDLWPVLAAEQRSRVWPVFQGLAVRFGAALLRESSVTAERFWSVNLGTGLLSSLSYAQTGVNMMGSILSTSVATVLLPALSQTLWVARREHGPSPGRGQGASCGGVTTDALRLALFLTIPATVLGILFSRPICGLIFAFSDTSVASLELVSQLLAIYMLRMPTLALISILLAPFYASEDVWTPVKHMTLMLGVNLALDILLYPAMSIYGFPTAAILTDVVSIVRASWLQRQVGIRHSLQNLGRDSAIMLLGAGIAMASAFTVYRCPTYIVKSGLGGRAVMLGLATVLGSLVYLTGTYVAGIPEARAVTALIRQGLRPRRS